MSQGGRGSRAFIDTNVLVYSYDPREPAKQTRALDLITNHMRLRTGVVSLQVLQEYFVSACRKLKLDPEIARKGVEAFALFHVAEPNVSDVLAAIDLHRLNGVSYWDAIILRCAKQAGCSVLLTEDMQNGQVIDGVRIVNPFV